jgi:hypothetical protein
MGVFLRSNIARGACRFRDRLTPGATRRVALKDLCSGRYSNNAQVAPVVQRQVFARYGLGNVEPGAYEVDYLITPALGGAGDLRNLWPQPYSSTVWNAAVKDKLEGVLPYRHGADYRGRYAAPHRMTLVVTPMLQ